MAAPSASAQPGRLYLWVGLALLALLLAARTARFAVGGGAELVDFDCFHIAARLAAEGRPADAYRFATLAPAMAAEGPTSFMPFTYPPPFELLLAPLGRLPRGLAYALFAGPALAAYLWVLLRAAEAEGRAGAMLVALPVMGVNLACGQNGLLTGALSGAAALGLAAGRTAAGAPLGLMVVKPHLAVVLGVQALVAVRWGAAAVAAGAALLASAAATAVLGPAVWPAFLDGVREAGRFLEAGTYPIHRMPSLYAGLRGLGVGAGAALAAQAAAAVAVLGAVIHAVRRGPPRRAAALALLAAPLASPYLYDYDLAGFAVGLVLLAPDMRRAGRPGEQAAVYALFAFAVLSGYAVSLVIGTARPPLPSLSAPALWLAAGLVWRRVAWRAETRAAAKTQPGRTGRGLPASSSAT